MEPEKGILLINKPSGISSFGCIREMRKILGIKKMGHAGTLDPRAEGLLIVGVGEGTKKLSGFIGLDKVYRAVVRLGMSTDTSDLDGEVTRQCLVQSIKEKDVVSALNSMIGNHEYEVSPYSALKRNGKRLYEYVREGKKPPVVTRDMEVYSYTLFSIEPKDGFVDVTVEFHVKSGVYIRSLAVALGEKLAVPSVLAHLVRTAIGPFSLHDATDLHLLTKK
ncbi:MAG: tRNA pseudouridine(55) synthase TruB [Candidatus Paceibacterota bacterium]